MPRKTCETDGAAYRGKVASMRPRPDAAENLLLCVFVILLLKCFNEAAARCRGKLTIAPNLTAQVAELQ